MKTITSQVLMLCMSLMTITSPNAGIGISDAVSTEIATEFLAEANYSALADPADTVLSAKKKKYQIIFENKTAYKLEVAIRYKVYRGKWTTDAWILLKPGEKKLMGSSDETTYFYFAKAQSEWRKHSWEGEHKFKGQDKSLNKLRFKKQDIWECYNSDVCNTFAVFR